jgi:hypothetical protein
MDPGRRSTAATVWQEVPDAVCHHGARVGNAGSVANDLVNPGVKIRPRRTVCQLVRARR